MLRVGFITLSGVVCLLWGAATVVRIMPPAHASFDFVQEWASARNFFEGVPIYASLSTTIPQYMGRQWQAVLIDVNAHPPASVFALLPLGLLEYRQSHAVWNVISLVCLAGALWLIVRPRGLDLPRWLILPILALILTSNSFTQQMIHGQLNLLLLLLLAGAWRAHRSGRSALSGSLLGIAAAVKLFPAYMGLFYLMRRAWRAVWAMGSSFLLLNGATAVVLGPETFRDYFTVVDPTVRDGFRDFWPNASINGFFSKLLDAPNGHVVPLLESPMLAGVLTLVGALAVTALAGWKCWTAGTRPERDMAFAACIVAMLLVSPITWDHYFLLLILTWAILWQDAKQRVGHRWLVGLSIIVLATIRPGWIWDPIMGGPELVFFGDAEPVVAQPIHVLTVISYQFYTLLALFVFTSFRRVSQEVGE